MSIVPCPILRAAAPTPGLYDRVNISWPGDNRSCSIGFPRIRYPFPDSWKLKKCVLHNQFAPFSSPGEAAARSPSQDFAVLLEVEGVLMDVNRLVNRQAFNVAFKKLGLDCANWSEPVYTDLVRKSAGDEERMLILYFNRIGWPTSVPTNEKEGFVKNVLRMKVDATGDLVRTVAFPLRPGAQEFIDEATNEGVPVLFLTAYDPRGETVASSIVQKLGTERLSKTKLIGDSEVKRSFYGQVVSGIGLSSSVDEQLAREVTQAASAERQRIAEEVASLLKLKVDLNTNSCDSLKDVIAAQRAAAEYAQLPVTNCILVAGSQTGVFAAECIGMPCVVLRSSSTIRAQFPSALAVMDGYGGSDLTISRLRKKLFPTSTPPI